VGPFEQVGPPDGPAHADGLGRVDRTVEVATVEHAHLEANAPLGSLLAGALAGGDEVQIAHHHADRLEPERVQHVALQMVAGLPSSVAMSAKREPDANDTEI